MKYLIILLFPITALAGGVTTSSTTEITINHATENHYHASAIGLAAAQHHFDMGTDSWQSSIGVASHNGVEALSFGAAKRSGDILFNGSIATENGDVGIGAGATWRW